MLPTINPYDKLPEIKIFVCDRNYQIIGRIKEAQDKQYTMNTLQLNELQFVIPLYIDNVDTGIQKNPHADLLIDHAIVKVKYGQFQELFVIDNHEDSDDERKRTIHAFSLGFQLGSRYLNNYKTVTTTTITDSSGNPTVQEIPAPITIDKALHDAVNTSMIWSVDYIDPALMSLYRYFEYTSVSALQFIYDIGTTYNAVIVWDTINQKVSVYHPDNYGVDRGFKISDKKYLSSLSKKTSDDQFATRLFLYGKDGLTINSVSPTGASFIDDFSYFMASGLMSTDLVNALNTYYAYVDSRKTEFPNLLSQLNTAESTMTTLSTQLTDLQNNKTIMTNNLDVLNAGGDRKDFTYTFTTNATESDTFNSTDNRIIIFDINQIGSGNFPTMTINGTAIPYVKGTTTYCAKFTGNCSFVFTNSNSTTTTITGMLLKVSDADFALATTDLITKYSQSQIDAQIAAQQTQVNNQQTTINNIQSQITQLQSDLDIANHLTTAQLKEFDSFIIEKEYTDDNCTDAQSLLTAGQTQLKERNTPDVQFTVSLFNFLSALEEKRNWNSIALFDIVHIQSYNIDVDITARIVTMQIDDANNSISLTIANTKNVRDEQDKFIQMLYGTVNSTKAIEKKQYTWDSAVLQSNTFSDYMNSAIDTTKQKVIGGINQTVDIGTRGIKIISADDPNTFLLLNNGVIGMTKDGGATWVTGMSTDGVIADRLIGRMLISSKLVIVNDTGTFTIDNNGLVALRNDNKVRTVISQTDGIKIQTSADNGVTWTDVFFGDTNGILNAKGLKITDNTGNTVLIDGNSKTIDFSKFVTILGQLNANNINTNGLKITSADGNSVLIDGTTETIDFSKFTTILGHLTANAIQGGTLTLGGAANGNGQMSVQDGAGTVHTTITKDGVTTNKITINRADGYSVINNGQANFDFSIDAHDPPFHDSRVTINGWDYQTNTNSYVDVNFYNYRHSARYLRLSIHVGSDNGGGQKIAIFDADGTTKMYENANGLATSAGGGDLDITIDLGVPTGNLRSFYLRMMSTVTGINTYCRIMRKWLEG